MFIRLQVKPSLKQSRSFYFRPLSPYDLPGINRPGSVPNENVDFRSNIDYPLNVGLNQQPIFSVINRQYMSMPSRIKMFFSRKRLEAQFVANFCDMLNGISNMRYETLEQVCESKLTQEIAAKTYEWRTLNNVQFRVLGKKRPVVADILNHFIVEGVDIDRQTNPSLHDVALLEQSGYGVNRLRYVSKEDLKAGV